MASEDHDLFDNACTQIVLLGERDPQTGILTIGGRQYDAWPESILVRDQRFVFMDEEGDREAGGSRRRTRTSPRRCGATTTPADTIG